MEKLLYSPEENKSLLHQSSYFQAQNLDQIGLVRTLAFMFLKYINCFTCVKLTWYWTLETCQSPEDNYGDT